MDKMTEAFELLDTVLKDTLLPTEKGGARVADPSEFMLMLPEPKSGWWQFKHCHTRNYLFVHQSGRIEIPKGRPFMLGYFDYPQALKWLKKSIKTSI